MHRVDRQDVDPIRCDRVPHALPACACIVIAVLIRQPVRSDRVLHALQSQLPITYLRDDHVEAWTRDLGVPWEARLDSPAYVQSNCWAASGRDMIVGRLKKFRDLGIRSYGRRAHATIL